MRQSRLLSVSLSILTAVFILTASIALPILLRPFYYVHMDLLDLEGRTRLSRAQITQAYDEMMDFCIGRTDTFSAGILPWSQAGADHFADVRTLFLLDLRAAILSGLLLLGWTLVRRRCSIRPYRFMKRGFAFWGGVGLGGTFLVVGGLAATNFSRAFVLFHTLFFPGKDNWLFDPYTDPIIRILPQEFFRNCAVFILLLMVLLCALVILLDMRKK